LSTKANVTTSGNLFASINGDVGNGGGSIFQYTPAGTADTFAGGLDRPRGLALDSAGHLFVAINTLDPNSGSFLASVLEIDPDGTPNTFATGFTPNLFISGLATDSAGNLFAVASDQNDPNFASTIYKFTPDGTGSTFASIPGQGFTAAFDSAGNLYAGDAVNQIIYKFAPNGARSVFVGSTAFTSVQGPVGLAFDKFGNLFVSTEGNAGSDVILKFTPDGMGSTTSPGHRRHPAICA
jgi:sugar lactone lactonase YvrE